MDGARATVDAGQRETRAASVVRAALSPVRVAVVDSGWDRTRPEERVLPGVCMVAEHPDPDDHDRLGHGTACIGEVLRWAPDARILPVRVFGDEAETSPEAIVRAIRWSAAAGARVVSLSLGTRREDARAMLSEACGEAVRGGVLLVSAGPNSGDPTCPAALPGVIGVWPGAGLSPGECRIRCADTLDLQASVAERPVIGTAGVGSGTSLAAAEVTGRIAHLLGRNPELTAGELIARLTSPRNHWT